jgi:RNA polymerase sigma-70 factor (ECF subfamily)
LLRQFLWDGNHKTWNRPLNSEPAETAAMDDAAIVRGLHRGECPAWTALYERYSVRVWRYVARLVGSDADGVADMVQETFLAAATSARQFDSGRGTVWSWLAGIAHHQAARHWRDAARYQRVTAIAESNSQLSRWWSDASDESGGALESAEGIDFVRVVLSRMPAMEANLLVARYLDQLSVTEMQSLFGGTATALRSRLHRARNGFREAFERLAAPEQSLAASRPTR